MGACGRTGPGRAGLGRGLAGERSASPPPVSFAGPGRDPLRTPDAAALPPRGAAGRAEGVGGTAAVARSGGAAGGPGRFGPFRAPPLKQLRGALRGPRRLAPPPSERAEAPLRPPTRAPPAPAPPAMRPLPPAPSAAAAAAAGGAVPRGRRTVEARAAGGRRLWRSKAGGVPLQGAAGAGGSLWDSPRDRRARSPAAGAL